MYKAKLKSATVGDYLLRRGCTQNGLAIRLGISSGYCSQLLRGSRCPSPALRNKMMQTLDADFDALFEYIHQ